MIGVRKSSSKTVFLSLIVFHERIFTLIIKTRNIISEIKVHLENPVFSCNFFNFNMKFNAVWILKCFGKYMDIAKHQSKYNVQLPFFEDLIFQNATQETLETLQ